MADNTSDIIKAMGQVPDMRIDPKSGAVLQRTGQSILQKARPELSPDEKMKEKLSNNALVADEAKQTEISSAYRQMVGLPPEIEKKKPTSPYIEVGQLDHEKEYMDGLVNQMKNKKRR